MPTYEFFCQGCQKFFYKILSVLAFEDGGIICPYCDSTDIEQRRSSVSPVPLKKTA